MQIAYSFLGGFHNRSNTPRLYTMWKDHYRMKRVRQKCVTTMQRRGHALSPGEIESRINHTREDSGSGLRKEAPSKILTGKACMEQSQANSWRSLREHLYQLWTANSEVKVAHTSLPESPRYRSGGLPDRQAGDGEPSGHYGGGTWETEDAPGLERAVERKWGVKTSVNHQDTSTRTLKLSCLW